MRRVAVEIVVAWAALSTIPAVGGYSNTSGSQTGARSDTATVGIVTQVEGGAFLVRKNNQKNTSPELLSNLKVGEGLLSGDKLWVEPKGLVRFSDTQLSTATISGPAKIELNAGKLFVQTGAVRFKKAEASKTNMQFVHPLMAGSIDGEAALWASEKQVQVMTLAGRLQTWHPALVSAKVAVAPGFFTETSAKASYLQPKKPARVADSAFEDFLARFEQSTEFTSVELPEENSPTRAVASTYIEPLKGTRSETELVEKKDDHILRRMQARMRGLDLDQDGVSPLHAESKIWASTENASRGIASGTVKKAKSEPKIEVVRKGRHLAPEHEALIRKLSQ